MSLPASSLLKIVSIARVSIAIATHPVGHYVRLSRIRSFGLMMVYCAVLATEPQSVSSPSASSDPSAAPPGGSSRAKLQVDQRDGV